MQIDFSKITSRPQKPEDEPFLFELYASTRQEELDLWGWPAPMRDSFLQLQFKAQQGYRASFPKAQFDVLLLGDECFGRAIVNRSAEEICLVDIALLPDFRNRGIGTELLKKLCEEAAKKKKPLRLSVLKGNRSANLYRRLGFARVGDTGAHEQLEWRPPKRS